jgi:capsid protein
MLKDDHISKWEKEGRYHGIALFAYLTVQMQNLKEYKETTLVSTEPAVYIKTGRRPGRPKKTE